MLYLHKLEVFQIKEKCHTYPEAIKLLYKQVPGEAELLYLTTHTGTTRYTPAVHPFLISLQLMFIQFVHW